MKTSELVIGKSYKIYSKYLGYRGIGVYTHRTKYAFHFKRVDINYTDIFVVSEVHELVKDL